MGNAYIYAGARSKVLERKLLSENQKELLVGAKSVSEMFTVLHNTYVALFLGKEDTDSITEALDKSILSAKELLQRISPEPDILNILWIKYDFYNIRTIIKGKRVGLSTEDIIALCYCSGIFSPQKMLLAFEANSLSSLHENFKEATVEVLKTNETFDIDRVVSKYYFKTIFEISLKSHDSFVTRFVTLLIDMYNIKATLRAEKIHEVDQKDVHVEGGSFSKNQLTSQEDIIKQLYLFGGEKRWTLGIKTLKETGSYTILEKMIDEYAMDFLKEESRDIFTLASLFSYFTAEKNSAQIIGAILTAKKSGLQEKELRNILRQSYNI